MIKLVVGCLISTLFVTCYIITFPFVFLWRYAVVLFSKFYCDFGRVLGPRDMLVWEELNRQGAPQAPLVAVLELDRSINAEEVIKLLAERVIGEGGVNELRQHIGDFLGMKVLKWVPGFSISDYISNTSGEFSVAEIHAEMMNRKFPKRKSHWEVVLFNQGKVVAFRIHHSIADGLSLLKILVERIGGKKLVKAEPRDESGLKFLECVRLFCGIGMDCVHHFWDSGFRDDAFLLKTCRKRNVVGITRALCYDRARSVAKRVRIRGSSVIIAGIIGALAKFVKNKITRNECLGTMRCGYVLPLADHPSVVCNHWKITYATVSLDEASAPPSTLLLKRFDELFLEMRNGSRAVFFKYSIIYAGSLISQLASLLLQNRSCGIGITNIAGDDEGFTFGGRVCDELTFSCAGLSGVGLMFCVLSYKRGFRICCVADESVLSSKLTQVLAGYIDNEFCEIFKGWESYDDA